MGVCLLVLRYNLVMSFLIELPVFIQAILAVLLVSLTSLVGAVSLAITQSKLKNLVVLFVSFAAGTLFGDVFFHLLPGLVATSGWTLELSWAILSGILFSLVLEKIVRWQHCHLPITSHHTHHFAVMNIVGDAIHNLIDGMIIAASFVLSPAVGVATTLAVLLHEIPQELGDFGVIIHSGISRTKALVLNFFTALTSVIGVGLVFMMGGNADFIIHWLVPFAAGTFLYIAGSDLIPELHKEQSRQMGFAQIGTFIMGLVIMMSLLWLE